jgi:hypothetical protein
VKCPCCDVDAESLQRRAALVDELASLLSEYVDVDMGTGIRSRAVAMLARVGTWQLPLPARGEVRVLAFLRTVSSTPDAAPTAPQPPEGPTQRRDEGDGGDR